MIRILVYELRFARNKGFHFFFFTKFNSESLFHSADKNFSLHSCFICPNPLTSKFGRGVQHVKGNLSGHQPHQFVVPTVPAYIASGVITQPTLLGSCYVLRILLRHISNQFPVPSGSIRSQIFTHSGKSNASFPFASLLRKSLTSAF